MGYSIHTRGETFSCESEGFIGRPSINMAPSGKWRALGLVRRTSFGHVAEYIPFAQWPARLPALDWLYKNGKPRWTLRDSDHGTMREWGSGVLRVYPANH